METAIYHDLLPLRDRLALRLNGLLEKIEEIVVISKFGSTKRASELAGYAPLNETDTGNENHGILSRLY